MIRPSVATPLLSALIGGTIGFMSPWPMTSVFYWVIVVPMAMATGFIIGKLDK